MLKITLLIIAGVFTVTASAVSANSQKVKLSGTLYDPNDAVIVAAKVIAALEKREIASPTSNQSGDYSLDLSPGLYSLEISANGFLNVIYPEYLVVDTKSGMKTDIVMLGACWHEPCGYAGTDCLPKRMLIRKFEIKYSPTLRQLIEDFTDNKKGNINNK